MHRGRVSMPLVNGELLKTRDDDAPNGFTLEEGVRHGWLPSSSLNSNKRSHPEDVEDKDEGAEEDEARKKAKRDA